VIRGTRVLVRVILGYLAHGETLEVILRELPSLAEEDVRAVIAFAAASASEDLPVPSPVVEPMPRQSLLELLATWAPLEEEFPEIENLEPVEGADLFSGIA